MKAEMKTDIKADRKVGDIKPNRVKGGRRMGRKDSISKSAILLSTARKDLKDIISQYVAGGGKSDILKADFEAMVRRYEIKIADCLLEPEKVEESTPVSKKVSDKGIERGTEKATDKGTEKGTAKG